MADPATTRVSQQTSLLTVELKDYFGSLSSTLQSIDLYVSQQLNSGPYKVLYSVFNDTLAAGTNQDVRNTSQLMTTEDAEINRATAALLDENKRSTGLTKELNQAFQTLRVITQTKEFQEKAENANFISDLVKSFDYIVVSSPNKNNWAAYPELLARFYLAITSVNDYIVKKIQTPESKIIQDEPTQSHKATDTEPGSSHISFGHSSNSEDDPQDLDNQTRTKREILEAKYAKDLGAVYSLIGSLDRNETPISWKEFVDKHSSKFELLRNSDASSLMQILNTAFDDQSRINGWDKIEKPQTRQEQNQVTNTKEAEAARQAIKEASIKYGALTPGQVEQILNERSLTLLSPEFKSSLVALSAEISTHPERNIEGDALARGKQQAREIINSISIDSTQSWEAIQATLPLSDDFLQSSEGKVFVESLRTQYTNRADRLGIAVFDSTTPATLQSRIQNNHKLQALLEYYGPIIPLFERVPPQVLTALLQEMPNATDDERAELVAHLESIRLTQQAEIRRDNGGKIPLYLELKDFDDPKLQLLIMSTKADVLEKLTELNAKVVQKGLSPKTTHRVLTQTYGQTQRNVQTKKSALDGLSISQRQGAEFAQMQQAYNDEVAVLEIQNALLTQEAQELQNKDTRGRVLQALGIARKNQEVTINPDASLANSWGFETLDTSGYDGEFESQTGAQRDNYLSGLAESKRPQTASDTKKRLAQTAKSMDKLKMVLKNPAFLGGVGLGIGGTAALIQGIATASQPLIIGGATLAGVGSGMAAGAIIGAFGGPIGALGGAIIGGIGGFLSGLGINSYVQTHLPLIQQGGGQAIETMRTAANIGQQGMSAAANAASKVAPETVMNASKSAGGLLQNGQTAASHLASNVSTGIPRALTAFQTSGSAISTGAAVQLVAAPLIAVTLTGYVINYMLISAFITPGEIPCYDNVDISVCKIASPSSATSVVDVVYQVTITAKTANLTITGIEDVMSVQTSSDVTVVPPPPTPPDPMTLKTTAGADLRNLTIPKGTTISYAYTLPLTGKNEYFNTRIVNNLTVKYSGGSDDNMTAKAAVTFGVVNISTCWPAPGVVTQGPWGSFSHAGLNEDAVDIGGNTGAEIYAPFDGALTYKIDPDGYGNYAVLQANGNTFYFGHMVSVPGNGISTTVRKGDVIGNVGNTGNSSNPHLHYELRPTDPNRVSNLNQYLPEPVDVNGRNNGSVVRTDSPLCGPN